MSAFGYMLNGLLTQSHQSIETLIVLLIAAVAIAFATNIVASVVFGRLLGSLFGNLVLFGALFIVGKVASVEATKMFNRAFYVLNYALNNMRY